VRLDNIVESELNIHQKIKKLKILNFYTSKRSISRSWYVMKGKMEFLMNFKWILKMSIPTVEMLQKEIQSLCNFSFLKIVKIEPTNKVQIFFQKEMPSVPVKQHFSYLSLH
jgi:hypothetical protein